MRVLVCGDRDWGNFKVMEEFILTLPKGTVIIEGDCRGADKVIMGNKDYEPPIELQRSWMDLDDHIAPISVVEYKELKKRFGNDFYDEYDIEDSAIVAAFFFSFSRK